MRALDLKLLRDLGKMKGQTLAVGLVMACGLAMMIMSRSLIFSLETTRDAYYERNRFADVFADLKRAPNAMRKRLRRSQGVAAVETRVTGKITLDLPGLAEPADGIAVSLPDDRPQQLNQLFLRTRPTSPKRQPRRGGHQRGLRRSARFQPGNTIPAIIRGQRQILTIVGIALSPEYVFEARPGDTLPDNRRFGVFWMNERELSVAFDLDGAFNNVAVDLAPGTNAAPVHGGARSPARALRRARARSRGAIIPRPCGSPMRSACCARSPSPSPRSSSASPPSCPARCSRGSSACSASRSRSSRPSDTPPGRWAGIT